jgi:hypothetical protein
MNELLSSLEIKPLEGQTQPVHLIPTLPVNMHGVPAVLISQPPFVPEILILEILFTKLYIEVCRPHKWRRNTGVSRQVFSAYFLHAEEIFNKRIMHLEKPFRPPKMLPRRLPSFLIQLPETFLVLLPEKSGQRVFNERGAGRLGILHLKAKKHRPAHSPPSHH